MASFDRGDRDQLIAAFILYLIAAFVVVTAQGVAVPRHHDRRTRRQAMSTTLTFRIQIPG
jgi:hypothetical protein